MSEINEETKQYMRNNFNAEHVTSIVAAYAGTAQSNTEAIVSLFIDLCNLTADDDESGPTATAI